MFYINKTKSKVHDSLTEESKAEQVRKESSWHSSPGHLNEICLREQWSILRVTNSGRAKIIIKTSGINSDILVLESVFLCFTIVKTIRDLSL